MERPFQPSRCAVLRLGVSIFALALFTLPNLVRADVIGVGDHLPAEDDPDTGEAVSLLPQFGGDQDANMDDLVTIVVGGTGQNIGGTASGQMTIDIPSETAPLESDSGVIGGNVFGLGLVRVLGLNSEWRITATAGGPLESTEGFAGLTIGEFGQGFLEIIGGGRVSTDQPGRSTDIGTPDMVLGLEEGSQGFITLDGFSSLLANTNIWVGNNSFGSITVTNRARLETIEDATLGTDQFGEGYVLVQGLGSRWNVGLIDTQNNEGPGEGNLRVGDLGRGTVEVLEQGRIRVETDTILGTGPNSRGVAIVDGRNSLLWTFGDMRIGDLNAVGEVRVSNDGLVRTDGLTTVGGRGIVEMGGGILKTQTLFVSDGGVIRGDGRLEFLLPMINNGDIRAAASVANLRERLWFTGPVVNNDNLEVIGGEMEFEGLVENNGPDGDIFGIDAIFRFRGGVNINPGSRLTTDGDTVIESALVNANGIVTVGPSGTTSILGNITFSPTNTLNMTIGNDASKLDVSGLVTVNGGLNVSLGPNYVPQAGDFFELITADAIVPGVFPILFVEPSASAPGITWTQINTGTSLFLSTFASGPAFPIGADFDADGIVDGDDFTTWSRSFGDATATDSTGDANGSGRADGADFLAWQRQFGGPGMASVAAAAAVPEPASCVLALVGLTLPLWRRRLTLPC